MPTLLHGPETGDHTRPVDPVRPDEPAPRPHRPRGTDRRPLVIGVIAVTAILLGMGIGLRLAHPGVLPGVELAGTQVGGMERGELRSLTEQLATSTASQPVTVAYEEHRSSLLPSDVAYSLDPEATAEAAWSIGRTGNPITDTWAHLRALWGSSTAEVVDTVDADALTMWTDGVADAIDRQVGNGGLVIDPDTLAVTIDAPSDGYETQRGILRDSVRAALTVPAARELTAPVEVIPVTIDVQSVHDVAGQAERILSFDTTLSVADVTVVLTPQQIAPLLVLEADGGIARLGVSADAIEQHLADLSAELTIAPVDAAFDLPRTPAAQLDTKGDVTWEPVPVDVTITPGVPGRTFDAAVVADAMGAAYRAGSTDVSVDLPEVEPETTTADLEAMNVTHLLGTFTTYYQAGQPRVTNIRHLADVLDGTVVAPGEQFSINRTSGERTCDKGYVRDGMIYNGALVKVCGGGVSQVGTAVFNAAFFAGVQIDQHKPHSWYISRYPQGREATLDFDTDIDVKFTNDTGNGLVLRTDHSSTHLTVSLYGTSDVEQVRAVHGAAHNARSAPVRYVEDPNLPYGTEKVVDSGHSGFDIDITRVLVRGGEQDRQTWSHRYVTSPRIVHRNTQPPEPEPTPSPSDSDGKPSGPPSDEPEDQPSPEDGGSDGDADAVA